FTRRFSMWASLLSPGKWDIIRGHEAKPHSRPYMAFVQFLLGNKKRCGVLMREDFVLMAAHCRGRGDSGGLLICNKLIQGIFSYGQNNGTPPRVFVKVSHFLPWIKSTMKRFQQQAGG
uniref:Peptidase S1 domain-containing protein n=1 Tax=Equus asinus TaxID=9793 RepID=A0A8C4PN14_EQUAS